MYYKVLVLSLFLRNRGAFGGLLLSSPYDVMCPVVFKPTVTAPAGRPKARSGTDRPKRPDDFSDATQNLKVNIIRSRTTYTHR